MVADLQGQLRAETSRVPGWQQTKKPAQAQNIIHAESVDWLRLGQQRFMVILVIRL